MELKKGYKLTEVGLIPEDWEYKQVDEVVNITTGSKNTEDKQMTGDYPFFVRSQQVERINTYSFDCEAVLTAGDGVGTGKVFHYVNGKFDVHQRVYVIYAFRNVDGKYFYYYFSNNFYNEVCKYTAKSSVDSVRRNMIAHMLIPVPPMPEQQAIACALSDVDELILSLEKLIAKKKNIKLGVMQELLTGKKRLPGFSGEWKKKRVGDILAVGHGQNQFSVQNVYGKYPILATSGEIGRATSFLYDKESVLIGRKGTIDKPRYIDEPFWTIDTLFFTKMFPNISAKYVFYQFCLIDWMSYNEASGVPSLSSKTIANIIVNIPEYDEQIAIAAVLSDMDSEIEALEQKLAKYRDIKQGMMQELLTGRIRLVEKTMAATETKPALLEDKYRSPSHNKEFDEAVVISALSATFGNEQYPMTAFRRQKFAYLLHRYCSGKAEGYGKYAAGPFNPNTAYGGPEKIAQSKGYVKWHKTKTYAGFIAGENAAEAMSYFEAWYGKEVLNWLEQFRYIKKEELELLATVDMAITDLQMENREITAESVRMVIQNSEEWKAKLDRAIFSDTNIIRAIKWSESLFHS